MAVRLTSSGRSAPQPRLALTACLTEVFLQIKVSPLTAGPLSTGERLRSMAPSRWIRIQSLLLSFLNQALGSRVFWLLPLSGSLSAGGSEGFSQLRRRDS